MRDCITYDKLEHADWLRLRSNGLGASDIGTVIGIGYLTPAQLFQRKVYARKHGHESPESTADISFRMEEGLADEAKVAARYEKHSGHTLHRPPALVIDRELPWRLCSPDRFVYPDGSKLLEIKNVYGPPNSGWGVPLTDEIPEGYLAQVNWQMGITGAAACDVAVNFAGYEFRVYSCEFNSDLFHFMTVAGESFWNRVLTLDDIDDAWTAAYAEQLQGMLSRVDGSKKCDLGPEQLALANEYHRFAEIEREAADQKKKIREQLANCLGDCAVGNLPGGGRVTQKIVHRKPYTVEETSYLDVRVYTKSRSKKQ